jgi:FemAB-related protein (PEP-CTERM system-associated)
MAQASLTDSSLLTFIEQQAKDSPYYSQAWLDLITKLYGYSLTTLTVTNSSGRITGFLPLCYLHSPITGRRLVSLPFADYCPMLAEDEYSANSLIDQTVHLAQKYRVRYLELRTGINEVMSKRSDFIVRNLYARWLTPLSADPNTIWSNLRTQVRGKVNKSKRLGVKVRIAQRREEVLDYYRLHFQTRAKKHGMPSQPPSFFLGLWDAFAENGTLQLFLAEHEGTIIAGTIISAVGKTIQLLYGASDGNYLHLAANNLITWEIIEWGCKHGYQVLDHGRTAYDNQGLMQFKRNWMATEESIPYYYYPNIAGLASTSESSWKYHFLTTCWRRLPVRVSRPLGSLLYKHLG